MESLPGSPTCFCSSHPLKPDLIQQLHKSLWTGLQQSVEQLAVHGEVTLFSLAPPSSPKVNNSVPTVNPIEKLHSAELYFSAEQASQGPRSREWLWSIFLLPSKAAASQGILSIARVTALGKGSLLANMQMNMVVWAASTSFFWGWVRSEMHLNK